MRYHHFSEIIELAKKNPPLPLSVAAAHDEVVLGAVAEATELGIIKPILIGKIAQMAKAAEKINFDILSHEIHAAETEAEAAYFAAKLAHQGRAKMIMKGAINSTPFLKAVLQKEFQLKTGRILSHLSAFDIPTNNKLLFMTDGGLNIAPDALQKIEIILNSVDFLLKIGLTNPKIALLAANERTTEKMPVTLEVQEIVQLSKSKLPSGCIIEGPLPLDLAISPQSLTSKGLNSEINGDADLLVVPNIECGNIFGKSLTYFAGSTMAGIVLGAKVPLVLNSRSDCAQAKLASIALGALAAANPSINLSSGKVS
ncbi:bifunctional enoyl-CoA hydratase/phosphate acetyltransferase [Pseudoneobacillus sp. C159]